MPSEKIIVLVTDRDDSKHGELSVLDDVETAERLVETLLEAGFDESRIRVFNGKASEFQVSRRPVVALVAEGGKMEAEPAAESESRGDGPEKPAPKGAAAEETAAEEPARDEEAESETQDEGAGEAMEEEAPATAEAAPVKFSSLLRSA